MLKEDNERLHVEHSQALLSAEQRDAAQTNACVCGYQRGDRGNWSRHRKECKVLKAVKPLQQEIQRLRKQRENAADEYEAAQTTGTKRKHCEVESKKIAIYALVRKATGAVVYIGKTGHVDRRMQQHSSYKSQCRLVRDAFMKEGRASFEIRPLMYCTEADADRNESMMITKLNTIHPNGLNLRCGSMAGVEEDYALAESGCTDIVAFEDVSEESEATAEAWTDVTRMLKDGGDDVDLVCKKWLKQVHPDVTKKETFTTVEVAAIVNDILQ